MAKGKAIKYMTDTARSIASEAGVDDIDALTDALTMLDNNRAALAAAKAQRIVEEELAAYVARRKEQILRDGE